MERKTSVRELMACGIGGIGLLTSLAALFDGVSVALIAAALAGVVVLITSIILMERLRRAVWASFGLGEGGPPSGRMTGEVPGWVSVAVGGVLMPLIICLAVGLAFDELLRLLMVGALLSLTGLAALVAVLLRRGPGTGVQQERRHRT